jgi:hypothetical protein
MGGTAKGKKGKRHSNSHFGKNLFKSPASLYRNDIQETQEGQSR